MKLRSQLSLFFGTVSLASVGALAWSLERTFSAALESQAREELAVSCNLVKREFQRTLEQEARAFETACNAGSIGDRAQIVVESGEFSASQTVFLSQTSLERQSRGLNELALWKLAETPELLVADPPAYFGDLVRREGESSRAAQALVKNNAGNPLFVSVDPTGSLASFGCSTRPETTKGKLVVVGSRSLGPIFESIGRGLDATLSRPVPAPEIGAAGNAISCPLPPLTAASSMLYQPRELPLHISKSRAAIDHTIEESRRSVLVVASLALFTTLSLSFFLARALTRSLERVTSGVRLLAKEDAKELAETGSSETMALARGFNELLRSLAAAREKLLQATRLAAWRDAARKIAHEIKNPLTPIRASVETLRRLHKRNDPQFEEYFDEATDTILREVKRMSDLATEFSTFAQMPKPKFEPLDAVTLVAEQVTLFRNAHPEIRIDFEASGPKEVHWDHGQISQIVHNLLKNAVDAVGTPRGDNSGTPGGEEGPRIAVRLRERIAGSGSPSLMIDVEDNGPGIREEHRSKLFEPYFTSKPTGTGLGLSISLHIAQEHGGTLSLLADEERTFATLSGAVLRLELPTR